MRNEAYGRIEGTILAGGDRRAHDDGGGLTGFGAFADLVLSGVGEGAFVEVDGAGDIIYAWNGLDGAESLCFLAGYGALAGYDAVEPS